MTPAGRTSPSRTAGDRNMALYLSLFLILAAFFLLLNSMTQRQPERVGAAIGGIALAFTGTEHRPALPAPDTGAMAWAERTGRALAELLPVGALTQAAHARGARLVLPTDTLFAANSVALRNDRIALIDRLAEQLDHPPSGMRASLQLRLGADAQAAPRAEALARALIGRGVAPTAMTVGVAAGDRHSIELLIDTTPTTPSRIAEVRR